MAAGAGKRARCPRRAVCRAFCPPDSGNPSDGGHGFFAVKMRLFSIFFDPAKNDIFYGKAEFYKNA